MLTDSFAAPPPTPPSPQRETPKPKLPNSPTPSVSPQPTSLSQREPPLSQREPSDKPRNWRHPPPRSSPRRSRRLNGLPHDAGGLIAKVPAEAEGLNLSKNLNNPAPGTFDCLTALARPVTALAAHFCRLYSYVGAVAHRVYKASSTDPDTLTFDEALKDTASLSDWIEAANKEIQDLAKRGTWVEVDVSEAKTKILPGTWVFR